MYMGSAKGQERREEKNARVLEEEVMEEEEMK
jgi:hypothetical protein